MATRMMLSRRAVLAGGVTAFFVRKQARASEGAAISRNVHPAWEDALRIGANGDQLATGQLAEQVRASGKRGFGPALDALTSYPIRDRLDVEDAAWRATAFSGDRAEGVAAFNEKRSPDWQNR